MLIDTHTGVITVSVVSVSSIHHIEAYRNTPVSNHGRVPASYTQSFRRLLHTTQ